MANKIIQELLRKKSGWSKLLAIAILIVAALLGISLDELGSTNGLPGSESKAGGGFDARNERSSTRVVEKLNGYDRLDGVVLREHRNNDGDSFFVRSGKEEFELRLYFVDTAEKYLSDQHEDQRKRVREQAEDFGLSVDETVLLGRASKDYVLKLLGRRPFTVYTKWDRVYGGNRFHGFVEIPDPSGGKPIYLSELLVKKGLVRIHTHGEPTPDGRHWRTYKGYLRKLEAEAKKNKVGAWGM